MTNQTQSLPRQPREGGWCGARGATCISNSGQGGQQCIPMPAKCGKRRGASAKGHEDGFKATVTLQWNFEG